MKKFAVLLIALVLMASLALTAVAQEDDPPSWQEQYWEIFWEQYQNARTRHFPYWATEPWYEPAIISIALVDFHNNGELEMIYGWRGRRIELIANIYNGVAWHHFSNLPIYDGFNIYCHAQSGELRFFAWERDSASSFIEFLLCWNTLTYQYQFVFSNYHWPQIGSTPVTREEIQQFEREFFNSWQRVEFEDVGALITIATYEETRADFFAALEQLQPITGDFAIEFLCVRVPSWSLARFLAFAKEELLMVILAVIIAAIIIVPALFTCYFKRKSRRANP